MSHPNTKQFRQDIREILANVGAIYKRSYTDKVKVRVYDTAAPVGYYHMDDKQRRNVCFYEVRVPIVNISLLKQEVTATGGYVTGIWGLGAECILNIRACCVI